MISPPRYCHECGARVRPVAHFCHRCGTSLDEPPSPALPPSSPPTRPSWRPPAPPPSPPFRHPAPPSVPRPAPRLRDGSGKNRPACLYLAGGVALLILLLACCLAVLALIALYYR